MKPGTESDKLFAEVENARDEIVDFAAELVRIPTVNPPCVADHCEAIFDRRFLREEGFDDAKQEIESLLMSMGNGGRYELEDLMIVDLIGPT